MPVTDYAGLTAAYTYPLADWVKCQLVFEGRICGKEHSKGWIMRRSDGVEGYIGGICATGHFGEDHRFAEDASRMRSGMRLNDLVKRLQLLLEDPARRARIDEGFERQQALKKRVARIREMLPNPVKGRLQEMKKTGRRSVTLLFERIEKREVIEDGKIQVREVPTWPPSVIGSVTAPNALDVVQLEEIGERFRAALTAADYAEASHDQPEKQLRAWAEALEDVDRCEAELDDAINALASFIRPENLQLLCWLCRLEADQLSATRAALQISKAPAAGDQAARTARDRWRDELVERYGGQLRVP